MVIAERGNTVCRIPEEKIQNYVDLGYTIKNSAGTVLREAVPNDVTTLKARYLTLLSERNQLAADKAALQAEVAALQTQLDEAKAKKSSRGKTKATETPTATED